MEEGREAEVVEGLSKGQSEEATRPGRVPIFQSQSHPILGMHIK